MTAVAAGPTVGVGDPAWAIADQGLFAIANFLTNILLARWLPEAEYGIYTKVYLIFLLIGTAHTAVMTEPMLVYGAGQYRNDFAGYLAALIRGHLRLTGVAALVTAATAAVLLVRGHQVLGLTTLALAFAGPMILLQWLVRRACYVHPGPRLAALAGMGYLVLSLGGAYALYLAKLLSPESALCIMGVSSLAAALWMLERLGVNHTLRSGGPDRVTVISRHWAYGRWALGVGALGWVPGSIYYLAFPANASGLSDTATLRALMNWRRSRPPIHIPRWPRSLSPTWCRWLPHRSSCEESGKSTLVRYVLAAAAYYLALGFSAQFLVGFLYHGRYVASSGLLCGSSGPRRSGWRCRPSSGRRCERKDIQTGCFGRMPGTSVVAVVLGVPLTIKLGLHRRGRGHGPYLTATAVGLGWAFFRTKLPATAT